MMSSRARENVCIDSHKKKYHKNAVGNFPALPARTKYFMPNFSLFPTRQKNLTHHVMFLQIRDLYVQRELSQCMSHERVRTSEVNEIPTNEENFQ